MILLSGQAPLAQSILNVVKNLNRINLKYVLIADLKPQKLNAKFVVKKQLTKFIVLKNVEKRTLNTTLKFAKNVVKNLQQVQKHKADVRKSALKNINQKLIQENVNIVVKFLQPKTNNNFIAVKSV